MPPPRECFVYVQLPGSAEAVVCGRFTRETTRDGRSVGRFVYGRSYRARPDAVPLDPIHLPVAPTVYTTAKLNGVFGALRDAAPDAWGRRVIERIVGPHVGEVDFLLESPQDGAGALTFGSEPVPPAPIREFNRVVQLEELRRVAALLEEDRPGEPVPPQILDLLDPGSSLGGARPKNVVEDEDGLWVAKFPQRGDRWIAPGRDWRLAPAYDLTPNSRQGTEDRRLAMECGRLGRLASRENLVSQAPRFGLNAEEANGIIDEMKDIVARSWRAEVLRQGGSERDCAVIAPAFVYPGFEYRSNP